MHHTILQLLKWRARCDASPLETCITNELVFKVPTPLTSTTFGFSNTAPTWTILDLVKPVLAMLVCGVERLVILFLVRRV